MSMHAWLTSYDCLIAMIAKHFHAVHTIVTPPITSRLSVCRCTELAQAAVASCTEELHSIRTAVWVHCELQFHECTRSMSSCFGESVRRSVLAVFFFVAINQRMVLLIITFAIMKPKEMKEIDATVQLASTSDS